MFDQKIENFTKKNYLYKKLHKILQKNALKSLQKLHEILQKNCMKFYKNA